MITIGRLADYAGVTTKTVRHYHERGLLAEPDRDSSGSGRHGRAFTAAIAEIDHDLEDRIAQLGRTREQLARLDPRANRLAEDAALWIAEKRELGNDPEFRALYLEHDAAYDWAPDDPRLPALADRTRSWFTRHRSRTGTRPVHNPAIATLAVQSQPGASSPAWDRLAQLMNG
ncbi:MerR family DNA-binding transcriptional regulator [Amycolatopsis sp.]|uniref:MerR family DNA-binding transcriptional regulator n=1 Tax=Amycolatopsis sp. TaxID=37632 RepID=UPI002D1BEB54|nr:MerR family DNA-binding transcriptional regulator [Amycolatopsis sp.]HVV13480.1 MerR family DNA-binding transcriptional regulator [Amycolatopsis sp.]